MTYISPKIMDSSIRDTTRDWMLLNQIASKMKNCSSSIIATIGEACLRNLNLIKDKEIVNDDYLFLCKMSDVDKKDMAVEGPGRKKYLRMNSVKHKEADDLHTGYALNMNVDVSEVETLSFMFSQRTTIEKTSDIFLDSKNLASMSGPGLDYVRLCQTIFREININAMRVYRRH
jgi:hypothetical protein